MIKKTNLPGIGLLNLKTALGVLVCILLYDLLHRPYVFFACISVIICLAPTMETSYQMSKDRMIGTVLGGLLGIPFLYLKDSVINVVDFFPLEAVIICLGVMLVIYLLNLVGNKGAVANACIVFLSVLITLEDGLQQMTPLMYSVNRIIDSAVGIIVALVVNKYFFPFDEESKQEKGTLN